MMPFGRLRSCSGLISGTTSGTSGSIRNAPELSTATTPRDTAIGAHSAETSSGTSNIATSTPSNASGARACTVSSSPRTTIVLPAERDDATRRISPHRFLRELSSSHITVPTAPVAPTTANVGSSDMLRTSPCAACAAVGDQRAADDHRGDGASATGAAVYDRVFVGTEPKCSMYGPDRGVQVTVPARHRDPDRGRAQHLNVPARLGERAEELRGHARMRAHAGADQRDLADVVVEEQRAEAELVLHLIERGHRGRAVALRQRERDVGAPGALGRHVLHDHVEVGLRGRDRLEEQGGLARLIRHADNGDLRLAAIV